jgi:hypothetical protein
VKTETVLVTVYGAVEGGFTAVADGRMDVRADGDLIDRQTALECLGAYLGHVYRATVPQGEYNALRLVAGATFADLGPVYANGLGTEQEVDAPDPQEAP